MRSDIGVIAGQLRDAALVHDAFDVIADVSYPLPVIVVSRILGVPEEDYGRLKDWSGQLTGALDSGEAGDLAGGIRASEELLAYMAALGARPRRAPREALISAMLADGRTATRPVGKGGGRQCVFWWWAVP